MLQPAREFVMVLATNVGGKGADAALEAVPADVESRFGQA